MHAFKITLIIAAIAVPMNTIFGVVCALAIVRQRFPGAGIVNAIVDLPLAISPVVVGLSLFLLFGRTGWFGPWFRVTDPDSVRAAVDGDRDDLRLPPVRRAGGGPDAPRDRRRAGAGRAHARRAGPWATFWRITLPSIRWAVIYGVVLTTARCLGEYGAVAVVSGHIEGQTETATLRVQDAYENFDLPGAYGISLVLAVLSVAVLVTMTMLRPRTAE